MSSEPKRVLITGAAGDAAAYPPSLRSANKWSLYLCIQKFVLKLLVILKHMAHSQNSAAQCRSGQSLVLV